MVDTISAIRRSRNMSAIRSTNTSPELVVRRLVHSLGYRFRLHRKDLPGKPDLVFGPRQAVIFVHGCFWHLHGTTECRDSRKPKSNISYWHGKLLRNVERDKFQVNMLSEMGWRVLIIWDCETKDTQALTERIVKFLNL